MERAWESRGITPVPNPQSEVEVFVAKVISKLRFVRNVHRSRQGPILVALMGYGESRLLPKCFTNEFIPYCFDCWEPMYERWESFFRRHRIRVAMFSARQSAEYFDKRIPEMRSTWIPEALDPAEYLPGGPLPQRDIDVFELGRRLDRYHEAITEPLKRNGATHLYEKLKGTIVFPGKQEFLDGLSRSKVSVCFPSSITHPERSGNVETLTLRYFESMASRCIVVGQCPSELRHLFGYNPVVEIENGHEADQLLEIVKTPERFQPLVDRNYQRLLELGTWERRVDEMLQFIFDGHPQPEFIKVA